MLKSKKGKGQKKSSINYTEFEKYVRGLLRMGYDKTMISSELLKYGYSKETITKVIKSVNKKKFSSKGQLEYLGKAAILSIVGIFFVFLLFIASYFNSPIHIIFLSFLPSILVLAFVIFILEAFNNKHMAFAWFLPIIFSLIFLFTWPQIDILSDVNIRVITALNMLLSFSIVALLNMIGVFRVEHYLEKTIHVKQIRETKPIVPDIAEIGTYLQSIEDKCKAMNFVIGRVYKAKNGGSKEMREGIRIKPEWYNTFSSLDIKKNKKLAYDLITKLKNRLLLLDETEAEVFKEDVIYLKNITRNHDGTTKIIDVLMKNDNDPVAAYFESALDFCGRALEVLEPGETPIAEPEPSTTTSLYKQFNEPVVSRGPVSSHMKKKVVKPKKKFKRKNHTKFQIPTRPY